MGVMVTTVGGAAEMGGGQMDSRAGAGARAAQHTQLRGSLPPGTALEWKERRRDAAVQQPSCGTHAPEGRHFTYRS